MPVQVALKPLLTRIWHAPDDFRLMDPLPPAHRRGILIGALMVVIGILLPGESSAPPLAQTPRDAQLSIPTPDAPPPTGSQANAQEQLDAAMPDADPNGNDSDASGPPPQANSRVSATYGDDGTANAANTGSAAGGIAEQWRSYRLGSGKTLAQLFRDNGLPPADVYAMAQAEGTDKPLSNLQSGQVVKIRQNAGGVVTGLAVEGGNGDVLFTRQSDGSFIRAR